MDVFAEIGAKDSHFQAKMMEVSEVGGSSRVVAGLADSTIRAPVLERMARNLRLPVGIVRIEVKDETGEMFPGRVGLRHEIRTAQNVLQFYEKMEMVQAPGPPQWG